MSKKKTYIVHSPLRHDGKSYQPGEKVSLTEEDAETLLKAGVISTPEPAEKVEDPEKAEKAGAPEKEETAAKQSGGSGKAGNGGGKKGNG